jgi:hypothetical protein
VRSAQECGRKLFGFGRARLFCWQLLPIATP